MAGAYVSLILSVAIGVIVVAAIALAVGYILGAIFRDRL